MSEHLTNPAPPPFLLTRVGMRIWIGGLLLLLIVCLLWRSIFIPIGAGQAGVLWSRFGGGTDLSHVFGEGYRVIWPWNRMAVYNTRLQVRQGAVEALTVDALRVSLAVTARFAPRPSDLPMLHRSVGPDYKDTVIWPDIVAAVRHVVRQLKPEDLQVLGEAELGGKIDAAAREAVERHWVDLDRVLITRITLPRRVQREIQEKLAQEQKALSYTHLLRQAELEREKRLIEADGIRQFEERARVPFLKWRAIEATERLANSPNSKIVVMGSGEGQLPVLLNTDKPDK
jgi:regulator of protease activity HflC (stomatin/prohibitin superfamily)